MLLLVRIIFFASAIALAYSSNIFLISNVPSVSHGRWYGKLANLLASRGHEVVMLSTGPFKSTNNSKVTFVPIENAFSFFMGLEEKLTKDKNALLEIVNGLNTPFENIHVGSVWAAKECESLLKTNGTEYIMNTYKNKRFNLIIIDYPCESFLGFVSYFGNPPFIIATPYTNAYNVFDSIGVHDNPSYVPFHFTYFQQEMNIFERAENLFYKVYGTYLWNSVNIPKEDLVSKEVFGSNTTHVLDILYNVSLLLVGNDPVLTPPKPLPPAYIPIGGFHIDELKPLPQDIKKFIDEAKDGVIYFSFGSNIKSIFMTSEMIELFMDVFRELPQRVIWKLEKDDKTGIPDNILISKWFPQNDILGHPNVRCFISHGGLLSVQEAIYNGVPVLGLPIMFDQLDLLKNLEHNGVGIRMEFRKLTKEYIKENINRVMDKSYKDKMQEWSRVFRESPLTPQDRAIWWIEYILRNPHETHKYFRSASLKLYWFQRLYIDIAILLLISLTILLSFIFFSIKISLRYFNNKNVKNKYKQKKEK